MSVGVLSSMMMMMILRTRRMISAELEEDIKSIISTCRRQWCDHLLMMTKVWFPKVVLIKDM